MRSVWSRVTADSITVVSPLALSPAIRTADLIWAEATGTWYSIGIRSAEPRTVRGRVSLPLSRTSSPMRSRGFRTLPIGRRDRDASPVRRVVMLWPAITPSIRRTPVPELPKSRSPAGSSSPPTPRPRTSQVVPFLWIGHPKARSARAVFSTSSPSSRPVIGVRPVASAPSISARCEMDLSPGTRTRPPRAFARCAQSGDGVVCGTTGVALAEREPAASLGRDPAAVIEQAGGGLSTSGAANHMWRESPGAPTQLLFDRRRRPVAMSSRNFRLEG